jgi:O-antigen biosynthesis protein
LSDELKEIHRRLERLTAHQREMEARLWILEDSRVFRILQRIGIALNSVKARLRPGAEAEAMRQEYGAWLESRAALQRDPASLPYQPRFEVVEKSPRDAQSEYCILIGAGGRLTPHALYDLAEAVQQDRYPVLYGDEDHGWRPLFKPGWSPELVNSPMYLRGLLAVRRDILDAAGEFSDLEYLARKLAARGVEFRHVPKMLVSFERPDLDEIETSRPRKVEGTPLASIVICSRNAALLKTCLDSIERGTAYRPREIIVVEHVAGGQPLLPGATYTRVRYSGRFDFAAMNNLGAKAAKGDVLVFLNDDVQPLSSEWLEALVAQAQRPEVGVVGALLLYPNGAIQHAGIVLGINGYAGHPRRGSFDGGFWPWTTVTRNVSAVTGACLAIRRELFEQLGGFDPKFPVNYNDVDLCLRAGQAGYQVILEAAARLSHFESRTRVRGVKWEELDLFAERWGEQIARGDPYYNPNLTLRNEDCGLAD